MRERIPGADYPSVDIPSAAAFVWPVFWEINQGRQTGMGFCPLPYAEIEAWARLTSHSLTLDEVRLIKVMDMGLVSVINDSSKSSMNGEKKPDALIPVTDTQSLKGMFGRIKAQRDA